MKPYRSILLLCVVCAVILISPMFGGMIRLKTYSFDTKNGEPELPADLVSREGDYYIIQCAGPILREWKDELKACGVQVFSYIPDNAYLVKMSPYSLDLVNSKPFITWTGLWQPAYKIHPELFDQGGNFKVMINIYDTEDLSATVAQITQSGGKVIDASEVVGKLAIAEINSGMLNRLAQIKGIHWIEPYREFEFHNNLTARWVQSGASGDTTIWAKGLKGEGQILGTTDSGITTAHWAFYHSAYPITTWGSFPSHRKIVNYSRGGSSATFGDESGNYWHGSHTGCTVCGDDSYNGGTSIYDGMAKLCKHSFVDVGYSGGLSIWGDLNQLWDTSNAYGAKVVSNSWGASTSGDYNTSDAQADQFMWRRKTVLLVISAGNSYSAGTTGSPGNAKGALTLGAMGRSDPTTIADYSSRGPTDDSRYKPTLMAPGGLNTTGDPGLYSARGSTSGAGSSYWQMSGTSMASPAACGAVGLIREYLNKGYYPTGALVPGNAIPNPSNALLKALAVVSTDPNVGYTIPNYNVGWGRIDLDSVLFFTGETRKLLLHDSASGGLNTNDSVAYSWNVLTSIPLRVTLCWTDTAGNPAVTRSQVNNLDLRVISPSATSYWGNYYSGGQSATGGARDSNNVEENFRLNAPATGAWTAIVRGRNVPTGANQTYAIVISGNVENLAVGVAEETSKPLAASRISKYPTLVNRKLEFAINLAEPGDIEVSIYNSIGARLYSKDIDNYSGEYRQSISLVSMPQGTYFLKLKWLDNSYEQKFILVK